jgi:ribosomal RNA-processing protein 36
VQKDPEAKAKLEKYLQREISQQKASEKKEKLSMLKRQQRKLEASLVADGKRPFYLKRSDEKKLELVAQYQNLKNKKSISDIVEKRIKRVASKQHKKLPQRATME